jgi:hypothetical protein
MIRAGAALHDLTIEVVANTDSPVAVVPCGRPEGEFL